MDTNDRRIINELQGGFPVCERPFAEIGERLEIDEAELIQRIGNLLADGVLMRFGPMYHAERMGGALTLAAMKVVPKDFDRVVETLNAFPEVAHNYAREHPFNIWFVLATETPARVGAVIGAIEDRTGYPVMNLPKVEEFFVGLHFHA
jgi:siroheme decarboxylase